MEIKENAQKYISSLGAKLKTPSIMIYEKNYKS